MSFDISVDCHNDGVTRKVYERPLGANRTVFEMWHVPATELALPLLGSIYQQGLEVGSSQIPELARELDVLEAYRDRCDFTNARSISRISSSEGQCQIYEIAMRDHLRERMEYLREAMRITLETDGVVDIG